MLSAVGGCVGGSDQIGRIAPHGCGAVRRPHPLTLRIRRVVDVDRTDTDQEDGSREWPGKVVRAQDEILHSERIDRRNPSQDAPANIVAETVVHDIERGEVAAFPTEELEQVDKHQRGRYQHRVTDVPAGIQLSLLGREGTDDHAPAHHAEAAIDELLQIDVKEHGVQLDAPVKIPDQIPGDAAVL